MSKDNPIYEQSRLNPTDQKGREPYWPTTRASPYVLGSRKDIKDLSPIGGLWLVIVEVKESPKPRQNFRKHSQLGDSELPRDSRG